MLFLIIAGAVSLLFGLILLIRPSALKKITEETNKALVTFEETVYNLRVGMGVSAIIVSVLCFFVAYYLVKKYG